MVHKKYPLVFLVKGWWMVGNAWGSKEEESDGKCTVLSLRSEGKMSASLLQFHINTGWAA
jgi:hypothetical protein